jgi:uncharacterized protein (DUF1015 family)
VAKIRPFPAIRFAESDVSRVIAPPYDVLDQARRDRLCSADPHNIVCVDLPHMPPKALGPKSAYAGANVTLQAWLRAGILKQDHRPALYPYSQSFEHGGRTIHRRGFITLVRLTPFDQGHVVPHELTHAGPIEDRLELMRATEVQLSPIFGLFNDPRSVVSSALYANLGLPENTGMLDGVRNDLWSVIDGEVENQVLDHIGRTPIYIADGHHRYTTALQYQKECAAKAGGKLPPAHPANWCMFVLVAMQDDGLTILPTHRLIGGLNNFDIKAFTKAISPAFDVSEVPVSPEHLSDAANTLAQGPVHHFALYDGTTRTLYSLRLINEDILADLEPDHSPAWRELDVAIAQRYLIEAVLSKFAGGKELTRGYTADAAQVPAMVDGKTYQVALLLRPTPLHALEDLGKTKEVMPQKSTFFAPKLATGMTIYRVAP